MLEMKEVDYWFPDQETEWETLVSLKLLTRNTRLVEARKAKGLTQMEAARLIGHRTEGRLSQIENLRRVPPPTEQYKIAKLLEKPIDYLFPDILMKAIGQGVFKHRDAELAQPELISLSETQQLRLTYDSFETIYDEIDRDFLRERIDEVLSTLSPREAEVLRLRFGLEDGRSQTLEEVGKEFNVTRERIRQIESKALRKLRAPSSARRLKDYLYG